MNTKISSRPVISISTPVERKRVATDIMYDLRALIDTLEADSLNERITRVDTGEVIDTVDLRRALGCLAVSMIATLIGGRINRPSFFMKFMLNYRPAAILTYL